MTRPALPSGHMKPAQPKKKPQHQEDVGKDISLVPILGRNQFSNGKSTATKKYVGSVPSAKLKSVALGRASAPCVGTAVRRPTPKYFATG